MTLALLLAVLPYHEPPTLTGDVIELNHYYDEDGKHVFDQWILWSMDDEGRYRVAWWRLAASTDRLDGTTLRFGRYRDGEIFRGTRLRQGLIVKATTTRETWTQYDPELQDRARK